MTLSLQGGFPRSVGQTLRAESVLRLPEEQRVATDFVREVEFRGSFPPALRGVVSPKSVYTLTMLEPNSEALDILESFVNVDSLIVDTDSVSRVRSSLTQRPVVEDSKSGAVLVAWTQRLLAILPQRVTPLKRLTLRCKSCVFSAKETSEVLANLRAIVPSLEYLRLDVPQDLASEVALHVLASCQNLSSLEFTVFDFDCLVPFLESVPFTKLRSLNCECVSPWTSEQANRFAQKLRGNLSLRLLSFDFGSPEANEIVAEAAVERTSILYVSCAKKLSGTPELIEKLRMHHGLRPRSFALTIDGAESVWTDLFLQFPGDFGMPDSSLTNVDFLKSVEVQLRNPACALRVFSTSLEEVTEESLLLLVPAIANCSSLRYVVLWGMPSLWVEVIVALFNTATYLKSLLCRIVESPANEEMEVSMTELAEALVKNEVLESVSVSYVNAVDSGFLQLTSAVKVRNVAMCVRRCRLLFLWWMREFQGSDCMLFDAAVVHDILVSAELDWEEDQRSAAEARGLAMVAAEMAKHDSTREAGHRSKRCIVM